jgi:hypothetical protein
VRDADGLVALYGSVASTGTLKQQADSDLFTSAVHDLARLRPASQRPTETDALNGYDAAAARLGTNASAVLAPTMNDLANYGVTALAGTSIGAAGQKHLADLARALIVAAKAFKVGLTQSVVIALGAGAAEDDGFVDPHTAFAPQNKAALMDTVRFLGIILNAFYTDLAGATDPGCAPLTLDATTIFTVHGDTPHDPLVNAAWPDGTPGSTNWMYVMGGGYLRTGWFGAIHADGTIDSFDPQSGMNMPSANTMSTSAAVGAAVAYAVTKGSKALVLPYYSGPWPTGIVV